MLTDVRSVRDDMARQSGGDTGRNLDSLFVPAFPFAKLRHRIPIRPVGSIDRDVTVVAEQHQVLDVVHQRGRPGSVSTRTAATECSDVRLLCEVLGFLRNRRASETAIAVVELAATRSATPKEILHGLTHVPRDVARDLVRFASAPC
jgi:hypothetical protein